MKFFNRFFFLVIIGVFTITFISCEEDITTLGGGVVGNETLDVEKITYNVVAVNKKIEAVEVNKLPIYQLGNFNDPIYGNTEATITSQIQLPTLNPTFGNESQTDEENSSQENERVTAVYLNIPFLTNSSVTDTNGNGITDNVERSSGNNPMLDENTIANLREPARTFDLDSIFGGSIGDSFKFKVERSTFFLRDLDPTTNFEETQEYFSNFQIPITGMPEVLVDTTLTITDMETLLKENEDNPDTADINESEQITGSILPGIRARLDKNFFQTNILDKEGASELLNQVNFTNFIRGLHLSIEDDVLLLLDLRQASITIEYEYDAGDATESSSYTLNFLLVNPSTNIISGNAVNTLASQDYPTEITDSYNDTDASRIYLKGASGSYAEIALFSEDNIAEIRQNNWIINEANLVFYVDQDEITSSSIEPLRLYLFNAETNAPLYSPQFDLQDTRVSLNSFLNYDGILERDATGKGLKYTIRITDYINDVITGTRDNAILGLTVTSDINSIATSNTMIEGDGEVSLPLMSTINPFGTVLFGSSEDVADDKRLKLEISYTIVN